MEFLADSLPVTKRSTSTVDMEYDGSIVKITVKEDAEFNFENSGYDRMVLREMLGDKKVAVLIDARANFTVSEEGMSLAASQAGNHNRKAVAYFTDSVASKLRLKVFIASKKPDVPSRIFDTEEAALTWLCTF